MITIDITQQIIKNAIHPPIPEESQHVNVRPTIVEISEGIIAIDVKIYSEVSLSKSVCPFEIDDIIIANVGIPKVRSTIMASHIFKTNFYDYTILLNTKYFNFIL